MFADFSLHMNPISLSPNFYELQIPDPNALCQDWRKSMENNRMQFYQAVLIKSYLAGIFMIEDLSVRRTNLG
jgi:hypothetical protein